jgi:hypothetical protein
LHGIDLSDRMIELGQKRLPAATLTQGGEATLESYEPPVDVTMAIDILEHLTDPVRAARALGHAGRYVALKIPLERRRIRLGIQKQKVGVDHIAGHLHFWTVDDSRRLLGAAGLEIVDERVDDPPESVRYHDAIMRQEVTWPPTPMGWLRRAHHRMEVTLERTTCERAPGLHALMFGTNHFVLARAAGK